MVKVHNSENNNTTENYNLQKINTKNKSDYQLITKAKQRKNKEKDPDCWCRNNKLY